jgi:hypothetical protein
VGVCEERIVVRIAHASCAQTGGDLCPDRRTAASGRPLGRSGLAASVPLSLVSDQGDDARWPAAVLLACDDEYLYVAASCRKVPSAAYPASSGPRPRDPDLSQRDRIEVLIDVDRDYATYRHEASGRVLGANDRVRIAVAGINGRGQTHITGFGG